MNQASQALSPMEIVKLAISLSATTNYWDLTSQEHLDSLFLYLNISYGKVYNYILSLDKNYFRDRWTIDTVVWQSEYRLEKPGQTYGQIRVEKVAIKYDASGRFRFTTPQRDNIIVGDVYASWWSTFEVMEVSGPQIICLNTSKTVPERTGIMQKVSWTWRANFQYTYVEWLDVTEFWNAASMTDWDALMWVNTDSLVYNQPQSNPLALISDRSLFVYPAPMVPVFDGIKFEWSRMYYKLTKDMTSVDVIIPPQHHDMIARWMFESIYLHMWQQEKSTAANVWFLEALKLNLEFLASRQTTPFQCKRNDSNSKFQ